MNAHLQILRKKAKFYAKTLWNLDFDIDLKVNNRLRSTYAQYINNKAIEFNKLILNEDEYFLDDTLLHELCHWACHKLDEKYDDGDKFFEAELMRIGSLSTETTYKFNEHWFYTQKYYHYKCLECGKELKVCIFDFENPHDDRSWYGNCCGKKLNIRGISQQKELYEPSKKLVNLNNLFKQKYYKN